MKNKGRQINAARSPRSGHKWTQRWKGHLVILLATYSAANPVFYAAIAFYQEFSSINKGNDRRELEDKRDDEEYCHRARQYLLKRFAGSGLDRLVLLHGHNAVVAQLAKEIRSGR